MNDTQKVQLTKSGRDAIVDAASLAAFLGLLYFIINPDKYDRMTDAITARFNTVAHKLSVWQAKLSIRSLPETDDS